MDVITLALVNSKFEISLNNNRLGALPGLMLDLGLMKII